MIIFSEKINRILVLFFFIIFPILTKEFYKTEFGTSDYIFSPNSIFFSGEISFDYNRGFGFTFNNLYNLKVELSKLINPDFRISFRADNKIVNFFSFSNKFYLLKFFFIDSGVGIWNYLEYGVLEYFFKIANIFFYKYKNFFSLSLYTGASYKISTIFDYFYHQIIFMYKINFDIYIKRIYQLSLYFTDMSYEEVYSLGYYQMGIKNYIIPNKNSKIFFEIALGFSGIGSLAGNLNRLIFSLGGSYEYFFFK